MQPQRLTTSAALFTALLLLGLPAAKAQSLYGLDGAGSLVVEHTGPPGGPCLYPNGPVLSVFPTPVAFGCPTAVAAGPPPAVFFGDVAVNKVADTVWVCDGFLSTEYTASAPPGIAPGAPISSYAVALPFGLPITGMGFDSALGWIWYTDGVFAWAEIPPPAPGCGLVGAFAVPPFPLPPPAAGGATDIEWDPLTGTLWVSDLGGFVTNVLIGGGIGPFGFFPLVPGPCPLTPMLQGLAVDTVGSTLFGIPTLYATDGFQIAHFLPGGAPAPPTFYSPVPCFPSAGPLLGLALAERALPYGAGADNSGAPAPLIGSVGQALSPNPGFMTTITGSVPGGTAGLFLSTTGFLCPPAMVVGLPIYINPVGFALIAAVPIDPFGNAVLATPLPPALPLSTTAWVQWVVKTPLPSLQVSEGLAITIGL